MSDKRFVDTNILVYAHDRTAGFKHELALSLVADLWDKGDGVISTQVLQELCVNLRRKSAHPPSAKEIQQLVQDYLSWEVVINAPDAIPRALELESRYRISFWDALIVQAAEQAGATVLYSEDLSAGQKYAGVQVVNPFLEHAGP